MPFNKKLWRINIILIPLFLLLAILSIKITFIQIIEFKTMDIESDILNKVHPVNDTDIVIVDIDDNSYQMLQKRFPWPRDYYARLVRNLRKAGAKEIVFDIEFDIPSDSLQDIRFAREIKKSGNVVLASKISYYEEGGVKYKSLIEPISVLKKASKAIGLVNIPYDPDGIVRHYFKHFTFNKVMLHSLAYSAFLDIRKDDSRDNSNLFYVIPPGAHGFFPTYSFWSVIDDSTFQIPETNVSFDVDAFYEYLKDGVFKNKIVFVGASLMELHDYVPCYYQTINRNKGLVSGVEYHASALLNLLYERHISSINIILRLLIMIIMGLIVIKFFEKKNILLGSLSFVILLILLFALSFYAFVQLKANLFPVGISIFLISVYLFNLIFLSIELRKERMEIKRLFQYYVSKDVVNKLIRQPELVHLAGEMEILTVLFTDIEGFTTISEHLEPKLVTEILNEYLSIVTDIIIQNGGMIDKYEGDAVMSVFGAPLELENHAYSAVKAGIGIVKAQDKIDELSKKFNIPQIKTRVGINSGEMLIGNLGTKSRLNYTVMGDSVNLGSRLESINKFYKTYLICSETTVKFIGKESLFRFIDKIIVKGKTEPISIYQPIELLPQFDEFLLEKYTEGIKTYYKREFEKAINIFKTIFEETGDYVSYLYIGRCEKYIKNPPSHEWDGIEKFAFK